MNEWLLVAGAIVALVIIFAIVYLSWRMSTGTTITVTHADRFYRGMRIETGDGRRWIVSAVVGNTVTVRRT
jgi:hypothetical protein